MGGFCLLDKVVKLVSGGSVINGAYPDQFLFKNHYQRLLQGNSVVCQLCNYFIKPQKNGPFSANIMEILYNLKLHNGLTCWSTLSKQLPIPFITAVICTCTVSSGGRSKVLRAGQEFVMFDMKKKTEVKLQILTTHPFSPFEQKDPKKGRVNQHFARGGRSCLMFLRVKITRKQSCNLEANQPLESVRIRGSPRSQSHSKPKMVTILKVVIN